MNATLSIGEAAKTVPIEVHFPKVVFVVWFDINDGDYGLFCMIDMMDKSLRSSGLQLLFKLHDLFCSFLLTLPGSIRLNQPHLYKMNILATS